MIINRITVELVVNIRFYLYLVFVSPLSWRFLCNEQKFKLVHIGAVLNSNFIGSCYPFIQRECCWVWRTTWSLWLASKNCWFKEGLGIVLFSLNFRRAVNSFPPLETVVIYNNVIENENGNKNKNEEFKCKGLMSNIHIKVSKHLPRWDIQYYSPL